MAQTEQDPKKELKPNTWEVFAKCYALENRTQYESRYHPYGSGTVRTNSIFW